jgi:hypothetical protein
LTLALLPAIAVRGMIVRGMNSFRTIPLTNIPLTNSGRVPRESGGERAAVQTLRDVRGRLVDANASWSAGQAQRDTALGET